MASFETTEDQVVTLPRLVTANVDESGRAQLSGKRRKVEAVA
jgi:hypothetical protein